jgi:O-antigen ligase
VTMTEARSELTPRGVAMGRTGRHRKSLVILVALLPLSYVPHELVRSGPSLNVALLVAVLVAGMRLGAFRGRVTLLEKSAIVFAAYVVVRLCVLTPLRGDAVGPALSLGAREAAGILAGLVLYRLARVEGNRAAIVRGLRYALLLMVVAEMNQVRVGLGRLLNLGYTTPDFNYNTAVGTFRPFGTFYSPVTLGCAIAVVGIAVIVTSRGVATMVWLLVTLSALELTGTRGAWLAFVGATFVWFFARGGTSKTVLLIRGIALVWCSCVLAIAVPSILSAVEARLSTITDTSYGSNSIRLDLWSGVLRALRVSPTSGFGAKPFRDVMRPWVGDLALFDHPHNNYLEIAFLYGVLGLSLFVFLLFSMMRSIREAPPSPLRAAGLGGLAVFVLDSFTETTWGSFNVVALVFLIVGLGTVAGSFPSGLFVDSQGAAEDASDGLHNESRP